MLVLRNDTGGPVTVKNALTGETLGLGPRGVIQGTGWDHYAGSVLTIVSGTPAPIRPAATTSENIKASRDVVEPASVPGMGKRLDEEIEPTRPELKRPVTYTPVPTAPQPSFPVGFPKGGKASDQQAYITGTKSVADLLAVRSWYLSYNPTSRNIKILDNRLAELGYKK